ncbi:hypothetical protein [Tunicatimonas pelagia]|uniref:hypothetical protein n=1 Tax=Tunicatimonas pelagia TaxID=931531 RepID=UPI0026670B23|nr:hypothetical protein [Tunicatimonas pelagia]WKN44625.1 hypothetical protein P0M28_06565 [Tunicatimonas pelagia]
MRLLVVVVGLAVSGCYSLTHVQQFTAEATETLAQGAQLEPTFYQTCQQRQRMLLLQEGKLTRNFQEGCELQQQADTTLIQIREALTHYLLALHQLVASERSSASLAPLGDALQSHPWLAEQGDLVAAYQELAQLSLTGFTERSRRKKARELIARANGSVQTLLEAYQFVLNDLLVESINRQQKMHFFYSRELLDSAQSFLEKQQVISTYMDQVLEYETQQYRLQQYAEALQTVGEGHEAVYQQRSDLQQQTAIEAVVHYTSQLQRMQLLSKFNF